MRRRAALSGALALLGGCGFRPLYLPEGGRAGPAAAELAAVYVPVMYERSGQLLRQALQRRFDGTGSGTARKYELIGQPVINQEGQAIQRDTSTTRIRMVGSIDWSLRALTLQRTLIETGSARVLDGFNIINQQFIAADIENEQAVRRIMESLADRIATQVATALRRRAEAEAKPPA